MFFSLVMSSFVVFWQMTDFDILFCYLLLSPAFLFGFIGFATDIT